MKKRTKLLLGGVVLASGVIALSSCTKSFCSVVDQGRMLHAFDPGVTRYEKGGSETLTVTNDNGQTYTVTNLQITYATWNADINGFQFAENDQLTYLNTMNSDGKNKRRGMTVGKTAKTKKAIVKLTEDSKDIEIYAGL